ncbi:uncharacterized protein LOC131884923 [Tigriopus californicus]|uniref:uncharacterized protein LOC131884923 n=1 Tax=Tigriopus californicus TaxID=6832 RepID=UPI0027D9E42E|nr:uncharacterized protein LOC131884923 [Tigriopus californicus]
MRWLRCSTWLIGLVLVQTVRTIRIQKRQQQRRQEVISDFLQTLKNTPKAHSLSPSWNGKSQYQVVPINHLPLQNEANVESPSAVAASSQVLNIGGFSDLGGGFPSPNNKGFSDFAASASRPRQNGGQFNNHHHNNKHNKPGTHKNNRRLNPKHGSNLRNRNAQHSAGNKKHSPFRRPFAAQGRRANGNGEKQFRRPQFDAGANGNRKQSGGNRRPEFGEDFPRRSESGTPGVEVSKVLRKRPTQPDFFRDELNEPQPQFEERIEDNGDAHRYDFELGKPSQFPGATRHQQGERPTATHQPQANGDRSSNRPGLSVPNSNLGFKGFGANPFINEEHDDFPRQFFEQAPVIKKDQPERSREPSHHQSPDLSTIDRKQPGPPPGYDSSPDFPPESPNRYQRRPPFDQPEYPSDEELERGYNTFSDDFGADGLDFDPNDDNVAKFKLFVDDDDDYTNGGGPSVEFETRPQSPASYERERSFSTTPRPIPTPGPEDFPTPPPTQPTAPPTHPTHPTHPPAITHPPSHYQTPFDFGPEYFSEAIPLNENRKPAFLDGTSIQPGPPYRDEIESPFQSPKGNDERGYEQPDSGASYPSFGSSSYDEGSPYDDEEDDNEFVSIPRRNFKASSSPSEDRTKNHRIRDHLYDEEDHFRSVSPYSNKNEGAPLSYETAYKQRPEVPTYSAPKFDAPRPLSPSNAFKTDRNDHFSNEEQDLANEESDGFFTMPENFPSLEALGSGFESMKIRNKRNAEPDEMLAQERRFVPKLRRHRNLRQEPRVSYGAQPRRDDEFGLSRGFWEDVDTEFYPHHRNSFAQRQQSFENNRRNNRNQYEFQSPKRTPNYSYQSSHGYSSYPSRHRDPYPQSSIQTFPKKTGYDRNSYYVQDEKDNEILGSGNFEVIKGGTFFDEDTYHQSSYNRRPQPSQNGNFLENFRDFADIKGDIYREQYY